MNTDTISSPDAIQRSARFVGMQSTYMFNRHDSRRHLKKQPNRRYNIATITENSPPRWQKLMVATHAGNKNAYRQLLDEFEIWLRQYFTLQTERTAKDRLVSEILKSVHEKLATCDPSRPVLIWLLAIADFRLSQQEPEYRFH